MTAASARVLSDESHRMREASNASWICSTCAGSEGPSQDSSVRTCVPSVVTQKFHIWIPRIPPVSPLHASFLRGTTSPIVEGISIPAVSQRKTVPTAMGPIRCAFAMSGFHWGQESISVCTSHTDSSGALIVISRRDMTGAFELISIVGVLSCAGLSSKSDDAPPGALFL
jgi:hypothetical protein